MDEALPDLIAFFNQAWEWIQSNILVQDSLIEIGVVLGSLSIAWLLSSRVWGWTAGVKLRNPGSPTIVRMCAIIETLRLPLTWLPLLWLAILIAVETDWRYQGMRVVASLLTAWIVITMMSTFVRNPLWSQVIALVAWFLAALNIVGWIEPAARLLEGATLSGGDSPITLLTIVKGVLLLGVLLWFASFASNVAESRLRHSVNLTPSVRVLVTKIFKIVAVAAAVLLALGLVGIDLSAVTILGGAIGVGIGFGLQKVFANLISGFILLLDKSIKPGDTIAVDDYYGRVEELGARYVSVYTRDGIEHLIPNEDLIVNRVESWSHSQNLLRLRLPVGVHYKSDVPRAIELCVEAAGEVARVLTEPKPVCLLRGFGDSSVDLEIRFWINDPMNGRANVSSEILLGVWHRFHEHGIEIPYPQRDIHVRTPAVFEGAIPMIERPAAGAAAKAVTKS